MRHSARPVLGVPLLLLLGGCGVGQSSIPELWDRVSDPDATYHEEVQVKHAIYCELKKAAAEVRALEAPQRTHENVDVTSAEDGYFPDSWGVLVQVTMQADEKSALTPGVSFKTPVHNAPVNFPGETVGAMGALAATTYGPLSVAQSYSLGVSGILSSQNVTYHKYNFYYSAKDLATPITVGSSCFTGVPNIIGTAKSQSSPFVDASKLGIREWLSSAVRVIDYHRSSRSAADDEGPPLGVSGGAASDSSNYDNKFVIISDASIAPNWNLVRIGTPSTPLFDMNRTRTHELLMTVGPGDVKKVKTVSGKTISVSSPSASAANSQLAAEIGGAVARAIMISH